MLRAPRPEMVSESNLAGDVCAATDVKNSTRDTGINAGNNFSFIVLNFLSVQPLCSLCLCGCCSCIPITTETQRTQRFHREISHQLFLGTVAVTGFLNRASSRSTLA